MITHLMMDVDGVIVDGRPVDCKNWKTDLFADLGVDPQALRKHFFAVHWDHVVTGQAALRPSLAQALSEFAPQIKVDDVIAYWFANDARLNLDVLDGLAALRASGLKVCLATNQDHERAKYLWTDLGSKAFADNMMYSAKLGVKKPHPLFFSKSQSVTKAPPARHLLIDDSAENVSGARRAGWHAALWDGETSLKGIVRTVQTVKPL